MKQTPLHALHLELGARMVPFAGYEMPVQYPAGIMREHLHTRESAGLFDVSHMGQVLVRGAGATGALERMVPADLVALAPGRQTYSLFTNAEGGVLDDLIITRWSDDTFFVVVNAGCKEQDLAHLRAGLPGIAVDTLAGQALLALQGPRAAAVMTRFAPALASLVFMSGTHDRVFRAYESDSGKVVWEHRLESAGFATPCSYEANGKQYLVVAACGGKEGSPASDEFIAFSL